MTLTAFLTDSLIVDTGRQRLFEIFSLMETLNIPDRLCDRSDVDHLVARPASTFPPNGVFD